jgi:nucleoside-diphosphate-sugar epimerase
MEKHKHIILGLGWLGSPLASYFLESGSSVCGSTRSAEKAELLKKRGIHTFLFDLYSNDPTVDTIAGLDRSFFSGATLTINIPPGRKAFVPEHYVEAIKHIIDTAIDNHIQQIIFVSTTAVFGGVEGEITNDTPPVPVSESAKAHIEIEHYLLQCSRKHEVRFDVLRLAGLVDQNRHPIHSLVRKSDIVLGRNPVNLVHKADVIQCIDALVIRRKIAGFYAANLCSIKHPTRAEYYTYCAEKLSLPAPSFAQDDRAYIDGKWINPSQTLKELSFELSYPSPYDMI